VGILLYQACVEDWRPDEMFRIVTSQLRAEPLGLCLLVSEVEYQIVHIRNVSGLIEFHVRRYENKEYYLPPRTMSEWGYHQK